MTTISPLDTNKNLSLSERVREIADSDHPWIPGAQSELIKEIATALETYHAEGALWAYERLIQEAQVSSPGQVSIEYIQARASVERKDLKTTQEAHS